MKVLPITNNNVSHKGYVGKNTTAKLNAISDAAGKYAQKYGEQYPIHREVYETFGKQANNILENMKKIMLNFGKTCCLDYIPKDEISTEALFVITSPDSGYAKVVGNAHYHSLYDLASIQEKLLKIDPDETNVKFRTMRYPNMYDYKSDSFAPEKRIWFIEKELAPIAQPDTVGLAAIPKNSIEQFRKEAVDGAEAINAVF